MTEFSEICNKKFETRGDRGIRAFDELIWKEASKAVHYDNMVEVEDIDDIVAYALGIEDDDIAELAKARVWLVIARMLEGMPPAERDHAMWLVVGDIPSRMGAQRRFNERTSIEREGRVPTTGRDPPHGGFIFRGISKTCKSKTSWPPASSVVDFSLTLCSP